MAVRIKFDSQHNVQKPTFVLATRKGRKLGSIPAKDITLKRCLNSYSEVSFKVYKNIDGKEYKSWDLLKDFKLLWCREWDLWFEIYVEIDETNELVKNVIAKSLGEAELSQINLYNIEINTENDIARDDYIEPTVIYDSVDNSISLLHRITEKAPHYSIKHVDTGIASMQRTFSFDNISIYDAFQEIAREIDCIFIIECKTNSSGTIDRFINLYDLKSYCIDCGNRDDFLNICPKCGSENVINGYGEDTTISVSSSNLADNIVYSTNTGAVKNCFKLVAGDDLMTATIANCNPSGSGYIWYFTDDATEDMSRKLALTLKSYNSSYNYYQNGYRIAPDSNILTKYNNLINKYKSLGSNEINLPQGLSEISTEIIGYPKLMEAYYNAIDFNLFLNHNLMPSVTIGETSAEKQILLLNSINLSPVAVMNLDYLSETTATSAVLSFAKSIIDSRYQIKVISANLSNNIWTGSFRVTRYSDENDWADSGEVVVTLNKDYKKFVEQKIQKAISKKSDEDVDIVSLFNIPGIYFKNELRKYSLSRLKSFYEICQTCLNILIEQGIADKDRWDNQSPNLYNTLYLPYYEKLEYISSEIIVRENEIKIVKGEYSSDNYLITEGMMSFLEEKQKYIQGQLDFENYIKTNTYAGEWSELCSYRREDTYRNNNYISDGLDNAQIFEKALEFIEKAKEEIYKSATLQHSITAKLKNLLVMKEFEPIVDYFEVGNWIRLRVNNNIYRLRLIDYKIDYNDLSNIEITFSDVTMTKSGADDVESVLNQASSIASSYGFISHQASKGNKGNSQLENWVEKGLDLTKLKIIDNAENQNITFNSQGLLCREYLPITDTYDDKQLKIINKGLYLTNDNWRSSKAGIGNFTFYNPSTGKIEEAYGVIADTLVGNLILSENVGIYNTQNSITLDKNGLTITTNADGSSTNDTVFTIQKKYIDSNNNENIEKLLYVDDNGVLNISNSVIIGGIGKPKAVDYYYLSSSVTELINGNWSTTPPKWENGYYIWTKTRTYSSNTDEDSYTESDPILAEYLNNANSANSIVEDWSYFDDKTNTTTIDGGKIMTGTLSATKITTGVLQSLGYDNGEDGFSSNGTKFDLSNGSIISKNFKIDDNGNTSLRGSLQTIRLNKTFIKIDGYSVLWKDENVYGNVNDKYKTSAISVTGNSGNLALAGGKDIIFGCRPNGVFKHTTTLSHEIDNKDNVTATMLSFNGGKSKIKVDEISVATLSFNGEGSKIEVDKISVSKILGNEISFYYQYGNNDYKSISIEHGFNSSGVLQDVTLRSRNDAKYSYLGTSSNRWSEVYGGKGYFNSISTSGDDFLGFKHTRNTVKEGDTVKAVGGITKVGVGNVDDWGKKASAALLITDESHDNSFLARVDIFKSAGNAYVGLQFSESDTKKSEILEIGGCGIYYAGKALCDESGSLQCGSSEKYKKDITRYNCDALNLINDSIIYSYKYKDDELGASNRYGLIIERECPKEVVCDSKMSINIYSMTSLAWKAIQELSAKVKDLEAKLNER